ncbi:MAG TPA: hypothetical protein VMN03_08100 [Burkholderiales bacterium]|nr:hypothetical protein [Burkholderiales bacterium]
MTATVTKLAPETVEDIDARLDQAGERQRALERALEGAEAQLTEALTSAPDAAIRKLEDHQANLRRDLQRESDRIRALNRKRAELLKAQQADEHEAEYARLEKLRELGVEVIARYGKHAALVAQDLLELAALEAEITRRSNQLRKAGAANWRVELPNSSRHEPKGSRPATSTIIDQFPSIAVGRNLTGSVQDAQRPTKPPMPDVSTFDPEKHGAWYSRRCEPEQTIGGRIAPPLQQQAVIPAPDWNGGRALWDAQCLREIHAQAAAIVAELLESDGG